jgi:DNA-binding MarR family transcriptional regulator
MPARGPLAFDPIAEAQRQWEAHGWGAAAPGMAMVTSIMRVQQVLIGHVDRALRPFGLTFARYEVLMLLLFTRQGSLPLGKVGARLQVHPASVTNVVDRLEADGLVRRVPHPSDGRTTLAEITDDGRALAGRATDALNAAVFEPLALTPPQVDQLVGLLRRLRVAEGDFEPDATTG